MSQQLIKFLEDNSLSVLRGATIDVREQAGPTLQAVSEDDLQVAMYTVLLKIIDALRDHAGTGKTISDEPHDVKEFYLNHAKQAMDYIDGQSSYTVGHTSAVVRHVVHIASLMKLSDTEIDDLEYATWIHNIGLLNQTQNTGNLARVFSEDERKAARNHTVVGAEMIRPLGFVAHLVPTVRYHHDAYDGTAGGPKGEAIPLGARIISIADAYQAMLEPRAYRPALSRKAALVELERASGTKFDPKLTAFTNELV